MTRNQWLLVGAVVVVGGGAFNWYRFLNASAPAARAAPPVAAAPAGPTVAVPPTSVTVADPADPKATPPVALEAPLIPGAATKVADTGTTEAP